MRTLLTVAVILSVGLLLADGANIVRQRTKEKQVLDSDSDSGKWDILPNGSLQSWAAEHLWFLGKTAGHGATIPNTVPSSLNREALLEGIRWPDMPSSDGPIVGVLAFKADFKADKRVVLSQSHYGCLQHWHSMAPTVFPGTDGQTASTQVVFSNAEVKHLIKAQLVAWWTAAVAAKTDSTQAAYNIGRILHTIGDSFPAGHTVRDSTNVAPAALPTNFQVGGTVPTTCGRIAYFQGYGAQHGKDTHADHDHDNLQNRDAELFLCAKYYVEAFLKMWDYCAAATTVTTVTGNCAFPDALFDTCYSLSHPDFIAGGALDGYQGKDAGTHHTKTTVGPWEVWIPKSTARRAGSSQTSICPTDLKARPSGSILGDPVAFSGYVNTDLRWT